MVISLLIEDGAISSDAFFSKSTWPEFISTKIACLAFVWYEAFEKVAKIPIDKSNIAEKRMKILNPSLKKRANFSYHNNLYALLKEKIYPIPSIRHQGIFAGVGGFLVSAKEPMLSPVFIRTSSNT